MDHVLPTAGPMRGTVLQHVCMKMWLFGYYFSTAAFATAYGMRQCEYIVAGLINHISGKVALLGGIKGAPYTESPASADMRLSESCSIEAT